MYIIIHTSIYRLFNLSLSLYIVNMVSFNIPLTFWFLWTSPAFFRCPRLHPVVTFRSEPPPSRPQYLQLSDINVLLIQQPKKRHRKTEQPIPSKTQPRTARNCITRAATRRLKFLLHEHAFHAPPVSATCLTRQSHTHPRATRAPRTCCASRLAT